MRAYERLIDYAKYETGSDAKSGVHPSTLEQMVFGRCLVDEMQSLGIRDAEIDESGYVYGTIESNIENWDGTVIGFIAHMDVVRDVPFVNVRPRVVPHYDGTAILLNEKDGVCLDPAEHPDLLKYIGMDLLVTDGSTLLGADDKAGVAEILTLAEVLHSRPDIRHGKIRIAFTPDEEIGQGADRFDVAKFGADFAYTLDGGAFGEVEYETFNAAGATISIRGACIHTGYAKDRLRNASLIAMEFNALLPESERPEHTENYEGFYHLDRIDGIVDHAQMHYLLRDHDRSKLEERKDVITKTAAALNKKYGEDTVKIEIKDSYSNMLEAIRPHWHLVEIACEAVRELGGEPVSKPVRGGTDGSRLSFMGLPCPNLGTGSHNHHAKTEFACIQSMDRCVDLLVRLAEKYAEQTFKNRKNS